MNVAQLGQPAADGDGGGALEAELNAAASAVKYFQSFARGDHYIDGVLNAIKSGGGGLGFSLQGVIRPVRSTVARTSAITWCASNSSVDVVLALVIFQVLRWFRVSDRVGNRSLVRVQLDRSRRAGDPGGELGAMRESG
jgi:hypothetical protein